MKYVYLVLTVLLQFTSLVILKLLDSFYFLMIAFTGSLLIGLAVFLFVERDNPKLRDLGWGLLFGSLTSIVLTLLFMAYLAVNLH